VANYTAEELEKLRLLAKELTESLEALLDVSPFARDSKEREVHLRAEAALRKAREEKEADRG